MKSYIYNKTDWDHEVIDVFLGLFDDGEEPVEELRLKGFYDVEWREAEEFAKMVSEAINVEYIGDRTDT
jgi:uncharacterized protein YutD